MMNHAVQLQPLTTSAPLVRKSRLSEVTSGRVDRQPRLVVYGVEGIGKSTFAAGAPNTIFLGPENGTETLDVKRYPITRSWQDVLDAVDDLTLSDHTYKTLAIDTLDWIEPLIHEAVCQSVTPPKTSIEDFGFGKGYVEALALGRVLLARLDRLRDAKGMTILLLAHCQIRPFKNPEGDDYDRYEMKLHSKLAAQFREWSDACLFANYEVTTYEKNNKAKGISTGKRLLFTERRAAFDAKNRLNLPASMPLEWGAFETARRASFDLSTDVDALVKQVAKHDADTAAKAREWLGAKPRAAHELAWLKAKLEARLALQQEASLASTPTDTKKEQASS